MAEAQALEVGPGNCQRCADTADDLRRCVRCLRDVCGRCMSPGSEYCADCEAAIRAGRGDDLDVSAVLAALELWGRGGAVIFVDYAPEDET